MVFFHDFFAKHGQNDPDMPFRRLSHTGQWEYCEIASKGRKEFLEEANVAGQHRWEIIHVEEMYGFVVGMFKRQIMENSP